MSLQAITITVTTPSSTAAVRFSTSKTEALIKKSSNSSELGVGLKCVWLYLGITSIQYVVLQQECESKVKLLKWAWWHR